VHSSRRFCVLLAALLTITGCTSADDKPFPGEKAQWHGFEIYKGQGTMIVVPNQTAPGKPWVWRARFWGHEPQFDVAMLNKGYHVVFRDVADLYGSPTAVKRWDEFYEMLTENHGFNRRPILEGMSRGGLIIYNWAIANPDKVGAIYGDAPVMDFKSWPGPDAEGIHRAYGFATTKEALAYAGNPVDNLASLAKAGVPIIHVVGDADQIVPAAENTSISEKRYQELGGVFEVIHKVGVGHHPHSLADPARLVDFMERHANSN